MPDLCRGWMILCWPATVTPGEPIAWRFMLSRLGGIASESPQSSAPAADQCGDWSDPDGLADRSGEGLVRECADSIPGLVDDSADRHTDRCPHQANSDL